MSHKRKGINSYTYSDFLTFKRVRTNEINDAEIEAKQDPAITNIPMHSENIPRSFDIMVKNAIYLYSTLEEDRLKQENRILLLETNLLSPNILQRGRFPPGSIKKPGVIQVVYTNLIKKAIDEFSNPKYANQLNLRGPRGIGKSFLLALYVLQLRTNENNRVLYINNPEDGRFNITRYIANELIYCFLRDKDDLNLPCPSVVKLHNNKMPLEQWYDYIVEGIDDIERITEYLKSCKNYFSKKNENIQIILAVDQMNVIFKLQRDAQYERFVKSFYKITDFVYYDRRITSASDNNEDYEPDLDERKNIYDLFDNDDSVWFLYYFVSIPNLKLPIFQKPGTYTLEIENDWDKKQDYKYLKKIIRGTNNNPFELSQLNRFKNEEANKEVNIDSVIKDYSETRFSEFVQDHFEYHQTKREMMFISYHVVILLDTEVTSNVYLRVYDRNLIYAKKTNNLQYKYYAICPAAAKAIDYFYNVYDNNFQTWLIGSTANSVLSRIVYYTLEHSAEFTHRRKDGTLEKVVLAGLARQKAKKQTFQLSYYCMTKTLIFKHKKIEKGTIQLFINDIVYFKTDDFNKEISSLVRFQVTSRTILLIPISATYPLADFIILEYNEMKKGKNDLNAILYLFQIKTNVNDDNKDDIETNHQICKFVKELEMSLNSGLDEPRFRVGYQFIWLNYEQDIKAIDWNRLAKNNWVILTKEDANKFIL